MSEEIAKERSKEDLLKVLHSISYWAYLTDLTSEMCYEVVQYTSDGISYSWIAYNEWPFFKVRRTDNQKWVLIRSKLCEKSLSMDDIKGTDLERIIAFADIDIEKINYSELFEKLINLPEKINGAIYCFLDTTLFLHLQKRKLKK